MNITKWFKGWFERNNNKTITDHRSMILNGSFGVFLLWLNDNGGLDEIQRSIVDRVGILESTSDPKVVDFLRREISNLRKIEEIAIWYNNAHVVNNFEDGEKHLGMLVSILPLLQNIDV